MSDPMRPPTDSLPLPYRWVRAHGLSGLTPWHFLDDAVQRDALVKELELEAGRNAAGGRVVPFATRQDRDDFAAFVVGDDGASEVVIEVHLTWTSAREVPGYPSMRRYPSFWSWLKAAVDDTAAFCSEEDLPE